jgi:hypothetical protein
LWSRTVNGTADLNGFTQIENVDSYTYHCVLPAARLFLVLVAPERLLPRPEDWNDELDEF